MTQTAQHSKTPWEDNGAGLIYGQVSGDDDPAPFVCDVCDNPDNYTERERANAELITRACNAHHDLVEALEQALVALNTARRFKVPIPGVTDSYAVAAICEAALAKAKGDA